MAWLLTQHNVQNNNKRIQEEYNRRRQENAERERNYVGSNYEKSGNSYDRAHDNHENLAKVNKVNEVKFTNKSGNLVSGELYGDVNDYHKEGYAWVKSNGQFYLIDNNGKLLCDEWFHDVGGFKDGLSKVRLDFKKNFIDNNGKLLCDEWFDGIDDFHDGYAKVSKDNKWNFIDQNGKLISDIWYDYAYDFQKKGYSLVKQNGKYNFIDKSGKILCDTWFDNVEINYERVLVELNGKKNIINSNFQLISNEWYDDFSSYYKYGYYRVELNGKYNYIDLEGKLIGNTWYDDAENDFFEGFAKVRLNGKVNYLKYNGKLLSDTWYDGISNIRTKEGYAKVIDNNRINYINQNGQLLSKWKRKLTYVYYLSNNFAKYSDKDVYCYTADLGEYKAEKMLLGYKCSTEKDSFKIKYTPIKIYGEKLVMCHNDEDVYLFNRSNNAYRKLGTIRTIEFANDYIFDKNSDKVYFVSNSQIYDVTDKYHSFLEENKEENKDQKTDEIEKLKQLKEILINLKTNGELKEEEITKEGRGR